MADILGADPLAPHSLSPRELKSLLATEREGIPFIVHRDADGELQLTVLRDSPASLFIGRRAGASVHLPWDSEISGIHAELECLGGEWTIVDDGMSTNGTFVNARRVTGRQRLRDGDRIRVGQTLLAFKSADVVPTPKTTVGNDYPTIEQITDSQRRILIALCRPKLEQGDLHAPASNQQIADEVFLTVDAVKMQLRTMFSRFALDHLAQNQKRAGLAEFAMRIGLVSVRDL